MSVLLLGALASVGTKKELSGPVLRDTARLSQRYTPSLRAMGFLMSQHGQLGAIPPPPFSERFHIGEHAKWRCDTPLKRGISAIPARYPKKQGKRVQYPPLRYYLEKVLRDTGGYPALGR